MSDRLRIYVCPGKHRDHTMAFNRSLCGQCGVWREPVDLVPEQQHVGAVDMIEQARYCVTAALNCPAHPWHGSDEARKWLIEAARLGGGSA